MAQKFTHKCKGLATFKNDLNSSEGLLLQADNVVIDRDDIIEKRRGYQIYSNAQGSPSNRIKQLLQYKTRLLSHYDGNLSYDDGAGAFTVFAGDYSEVESGLRIKGIELNGNLYFTTSKGIRKISATSPDQFTTASDYVTYAGGVKAYDVKVTADYNTLGFLDADSVVAYRIVWGTKDINNNLILGTPSAISIIRNPTNISSVVTLEFTIPNQITSNYFYQIYRSPLKTPFTQTPEDELNLVIEDFPTPLQLSNGLVTVNDGIPDDFRESGALLYTNAISGEGISQSNEAPPLAKDINFYRNSTFFSNTATRHKYLLSLISLNFFISGTSSFIVGNGSQASTYTFVGATESSRIDFASYAGAFPATLLGKYLLINSYNNNRSYFLYFDTTGTDPQPNALDTTGRLPIKITITALVTAEAVVEAISNQLNINDDFSCSFSAKQVTINRTANGFSNNIVDSAINPIGNGVILSTLVNGQGENASLGQVLLSNNISVGERIDESARSLVAVINRNSSDIVNASYLSGVNDIPGQILLESKVLENAPFYIAVGQQVIADSFSPTLPYEQSILSNTLAAVTVITSTAHGLTTGSKVIIYDYNGFPSIEGLYTATSLTANTFSIPVNTSGGSSGTARFFKAIQASDNEVKPNRVYYSKTDQPEAVPVGNYFDVGPKDKKILRILSLRDSLFILKEDGVYRISGDSPSNFVLALFDSSVILSAPDSAQVLNNQVYMLTTQGIVALSENGSPIVSRDIEDQITNATLNPNYKTISFGVPYEMDRAFCLWLPTSKTDITATQCYRYNVFTQCWTRWTKNNTCGIVLIPENKMYLGAGDLNRIEKERKDLDRSDYAEREYAKIIGPNAIVGAEIAIGPNVSNIVVGDILYQKQWITVSRFNRLLKQLDNDSGLSSSNYYDTLNIITGSSLSSNMSLLVTKLLIDDPAGGYSFNGSLDFSVIRTEFNEVAEKLNISAQVFYTDYKNYNDDDAVVYEEVVISIKSNKITLREEIPLIQGACIIFQNIDSTIQWHPETLGDASVQKQIPEATVMFEQFNFTSANLSFKSDLSNNFEGSDFKGEGAGSFGQQDLGEFVYGGQGNQRPYRTYVPRNKQRCRFLVLKFEHMVAREQFAINGYSVTHNSNPTPRAYRS